MKIAEEEVRRSIDIWGAEDVPSGGVVGREEIKRNLADPDGTYRRLRRVMDAWTALWFWPLTERASTVGGRQVEPPTMDQWIAALQAILGRPHSTRAKGASTMGARSLSAVANWDDLNLAEKAELSFAGARPIVEILNVHPWLEICEHVAVQHGFLHWNLDFVTVFARGGFDLQLGNPPWVRPDFSETETLAEFDPVWALAAKIPNAMAERMKASALAADDARDYYIDTVIAQNCTHDYASSLAQYPYLQGLRPDLYRCFMQQAWRNASECGTMGLIHLESHFSDENAGKLREEAYLRLRRHWQFINELKLFEIQNQKHYGVNVYGKRLRSPHFKNAVAMYHPDTVIRSLNHDGSGQEPGYKDPDGNWDLRPHASRLATVTDETLATWRAIIEESDVPIRQARMSYAVNRSAASVLYKLSHAPRVGGLGLQFSDGWNETTDRKRGYFRSEWGVPKSWGDVILQGPHLFVATPLYKTPNETMLSHRDWSPTDFETLPPGAVPATSYKPIGRRERYDAAYTKWLTKKGRYSAREYYRVAWRNMAANTGERTLLPALIPPGPAHVHGISSSGLPSKGDTSIVNLAAFASSLVADFLIRSVPKSTISLSSLERLPFLIAPALEQSLRVRCLRLNCVTDVYGSLWEECYSPDSFCDNWTGGFMHSRRRHLCDVGPEWTAETPLRIAADRRQALVEIDALVALMLGLTAEELCTIYRTQFAVLYGYDHHDYVYDTNGRLVPNSVLTEWRKKGERLSVEERTATNQAGNTYTYELPFRILDREKDMTEAYEEFERRLAARS